MWPARLTSAASPAARSSSGSGSSAALACSRSAGAGGALCSGVQLYRPWLAGPAPPALHAATARHRASSPRRRRAVAPRAAQQPLEGAAVSTVDALLTAMEGEAEGEEPSSEVSSAEAELLHELEATPTGSSEEANPYTPDDALSSGRPGRLGVLPASPELEQLLADAAESDGVVSLEQLQRLFPFQLDGFQAKAVEQLLAGRSVVVCAPTGAGKTAIAEAAAAATLARGQRVIYTTPLKALSNQKLVETAERFGSSRCGLQTGDTSLNTEADIVIMTTEILRNIMYRTAEVVGPGKTGGTRDERLGDVGLIVLDEVHYLGDPWRGSVWEEAIINCPRHIQMLAMSATVKNPDDLGGWISQVHGECATIKTRFRPVPLHWTFCHKVPRRGTLLEDLLAGGGAAAAAAAAGAGGSWQQQRGQGRGGRGRGRGRAGAGRGVQPSQANGAGQGSSSDGSDGDGLAAVAPAALRINPRLRLDDWIAEELRFEAQRQVQRARDEGREPYGSFDPFAADESDWGYAAGAGRGAGRGGGGRGRNREREQRDLVRRVMGKHTPPQEQVIRQLQASNLLPAIYFIMSRRDCDLSAIATASSVSLVTPDEAAQLEEALQQLIEENPEGVRERLVEAFRRGISSHHAGCLPAWKALVERCFQRGLLKLVYATGTLAAGINMPARCTVISSLARRADDGIQLLPHNELLQMAGRAGRRGYDTEGYCVVIQGRFEGAEAAHSIIAAGPEPLQSQFTTSYSLVLNLLSAYSLDEAREFLSKTFGTYLIQQQNRKCLDEARQLLQAASELTQAAPAKPEASEAQRAALAAVKRQKGLLLSLLDAAVQERCQAVQQLLLPPDAWQPQQQAQQQQQEQEQQAQQEQQLQQPQQPQQEPPLSLPALVLLDLGRRPMDTSKPREYLPALAVRLADSAPLPSGSRREREAAPFVQCLGADNRPIVVSAQHVAGYLPPGPQLAALLSDHGDALARLQALLEETTHNPKVWANLSTRLFSAQVSFGSGLTSGLALAINMCEAEAFQLLQPSAAMAGRIEAQRAELAAAKAALQQLQKADAEAEAAAEAEGSSAGSGGSGGSGGNGGAGSSGVMTAALGKLKGRDRAAAARRLVKQAKRLMAEAQEEGQLSTWSCFMDVLGILIEMGAMEEGSLRLLPLGRVARGINCNNELWMAAAMSHPDVMCLSPPQLAALVGALQCTDLAKRSMTIWSSYQVSDAVVGVIEALEPLRQAIFEAQTAAGQIRWNEHLAVDLRLAGLVEAWAGGASWAEVMADTSLDDGDMARLLARTADMLKQLMFLEEHLPYLVPTAREALRGMDRKPISDLVA